MHTKAETKASKVETAQSEVEAAVKHPEAKESKRSLTAYRSSKRLEKVYVTLENSACRNLTPLLAALVSLRSNTMESYSRKRHLRVNATLLAVNLSRTGKPFVCWKNSKLVVCNNTAVILPVRSGGLAGGGQQR